jgi:hypothetical protein
MHCTYSVQYLMDPNAVGQGIKPGTEVGELVSNIDIGPTLCELGGTSRACLAGSVFLYSKCASQTIRRVVHRQENGCGHQLLFSNSLALPCCSLYRDCPSQPHGWAVHGAAPHQLRRRR